MSLRRMLCAAVALGVLASGPALAQGRQGHSRGGGARTQDGGQRAVPRAVPRAPAAGRSYEQRAPVRSNAYRPPPRSDARQARPGVGPGAGSTYRGPGAAASRYADRGWRAQGNPGRYAVPRPAPGYVTPGSAHRGDVSPRYPSRAYAAPRYRAHGDGYRYPHGYGYGYGYGSGYGYGRGYRYGRPFVAPRYVHPYVVTILPYEPYFYRPSFGVGIVYGADGLYPYGFTPRAFYDPLPGVVYGGLRITGAPREAEVFADGYYVGIVDDFDGEFQHVNLEPGEHRIEIHLPGASPIAFDVVVQPGRTTTLRANLY